MKKYGNKYSLLGIGFVVVAAVITIVGINYLGWFNKTVSTAEIQPQIVRFQRLPLTFVENLGQWDSKVAYMARKQGMSAWLQKDGITFRFEKRNACNLTQGVTIQMTFEGASERVLLEGEGRQSSKHNFFIGKDRSQWRSGISSYAQVVYDNLYDGVDLCVREQEGWLEYDVLLSEGADLSDVVICCEGLKGLMIDENGILVMETEFGLITQKPPKAWYELPSGDRLPVTCNFRKIDNRRYGFAVENDLGLALVIDPGLEWSTFLGAGGFDRIICLGLDVSGNVIVSGETWSMDFPTTYGVYDTTHNGQCDIFVSCLTANGDSLLWSTFIGGSGRDEPYDLAIDNQGRPTVVGVTMSSDFPTTPGAFDTTLSGQRDAVMVRLNADGTGLVYSTYLGGSEEDWICTIDLNGSGETYVGGYTSSADFPTTPGTYDTTHNGLRDAFVAHLNADGSDLLYSTFLGGSNHEGWAYDINIFITRQMALALDISGEVVIAGMTASPNFPTTPGAYDTSYNGSYDIFVTRLNTAASDIIYSTFLGGISTDYAYAKDLVLAASGVVTIAGATYSSDFPTTAGAYNENYNSDADVFVAQFDATASNLLYSTYIGGTVEDFALSITVDNQDKIIITGGCRQNFPTTSGAFDTTWNGLEDVFVSRMSLDGNGQADLLYSTYLGGPGYDWATSVAIVDDSTLVIAGQAGVGFPTTASAYDTSFNYGGQDGFVCKFSPYVGIEENKMHEPLASKMLGPVFPNPSYNEFNYNINLTQASEVKVCVVDVTGRLIETLINEQLPTGIHHFSWHPPKELANGIYFLNLQAGDYTTTEKLLLIR
jgi:hypothetical protein